MSEIKKERRVVITVTEGEANAGGVKVKFDFFPDLGGVGTHPDLKAAVVALLKLVNNKFETP